MTIWSPMPGFGQNVTFHFFIALLILVTPPLGIRCNLPTSFEPTILFVLKYAGSESKLVLT